MTNIDADILTTITGGAAAAQPAKPNASSIFGDALQGCASSVASTKATPGKAPNFAQIGLSCASGAGSSLLKSITGLFGSK
jgi:hypothetical protein